MMISRKQFLKTAAAAGVAWPAILAASDSGAKGSSRFTVSRRRLMLRHAWTISRNSSDFKDNVFVSKVKEAVDFPVLKIKVGRDNDEALLAAVREVTDRPLRVDANEGWRDKEVAIRKIRWLQGLGVELIEQPLPAAMIEETAWLRQRADIPIIADEAVKCAGDIPGLAGAYDGINIKLMKAGGIQEAIHMIHVARALGLKVMLGCMIESSLGISAAAHLTPLVDYADLDGNLLISNDPFLGATVEHGKLILNDRPGLGISERPA